jgi:small subunit ribosomal protein S1
MQFKVIEFSKSAKRIILSHSRVFEDVKKAEDNAIKKAASDEAKKANKKVKSSLEKTTLGDITELAALKEEMEEREKNSKK